MNWEISGQLIEILDGSLVPVLFALSVSASIYLYRLWRDAGYSFRNMDSQTAVDATGAWAAALLFLGLGMKNTSFWVWRHLQNHNEQIQNWAMWCTVLLIVGIGITLWASVCWLRNILPIRCSHWAWAWIVAGSIAFAVWFSMP